MRRPGAASCGGSQLVRSREAEADPANRVQEPRLARIVSQLAPQPADVDVERLRRAEPGRVPDVLERLLARDDRAGVLHQERKELVLLAAQLERLAVLRHLALRRVEAEL